MAYKLPQISVILPVHNAGAFLESCLKSLYSQTFKDFECLIINDASTDRSVSILAAIQDERFRIYHLPRQSGVPRALNFGLERIRGKYVARMDADDICHPRRFERQFDFMEAHEEVGVLGSWAHYFGENNYLRKFPSRHADIASGLLFFGTVLHPTVMMRASFFKEENIRYHTSYRHAEDTELWTRLIHRTRFANLSEPLLKRRIHNAMACYQHAKKMRFFLFKLRGLLLEEWIRDLRQKTRLQQVFRDLAARNSFHAHKQEFAAWVGWLEQVKKYSNHPAWPCQEVHNIIRAWRRMIVQDSFLKHRRYGLRIFLEYFLQPSRPWQYMSWQSNLKFAFKCLMGWQARKRLPSSIPMHLRTLAQVLRPAR